MLLSQCGREGDRTQVVEAPAAQEYCVIDIQGTTVIPNGRLITPYGRSFVIAPHPYGLTLSRNGQIAVTANSGTGPLSISILRNVCADEPEIRQIPPGPATDKGVLASVFMGLAISPDNTIVYVAGGQENRVFLFDIATGEKRGSIDCAAVTAGADYSHGYIGDMVLSRDGATLYAVDQVNFRVIIISTRQGAVRYNVPVGRYPFGIVLSPDERRLYVANVGMFAYSAIKGVNEKDLKHSALSFPASAFDSKEMREGYTTGSLTIPALGDPNVPESFSVWTIDLSASGQPTVVAKIKTGTVVGAPVEDIPAVGGSSPNSLAATSAYVFVSNGNNDNISVIDRSGNTIVRTIALKPDARVRNFRGVIPFGLAISPDERRLYVAEAGINAVGVVDIPTLQVIGHIPVGWFPSKLAVTSDGRTLVVANAKGYGSGPNGGKGYVARPEGTYIGSLMRGTVSVIPIPTDEGLQALTKKVLVNNYRFETAGSESFRWRRNNPVPLYPGQRGSPIRYIVFVSKENRTYDEVFGQITKGKGDSTLARYGRDVTFTDRKGSRSVNHATVMPNHLALAHRWTIADNFYVDSDVSADGHRWLVNTYPNEWVETNTAASYGGNRTFKSESKAPGSLAMNGSAGAIYPEDYNEAGSMWEHLDRHGINFYNFGCGVMFEPASYDVSYKDTGIRHIYNFPLPSPMYNRTSRTYPTFNMAIPDQYRIDMFMREFNERWGDADSTLPPVLTIIVPNDHGAEERPEAGYPFRESYMADNDLAIGRLVEFLSHTRYWKQMAIVITEDDAQNGVDHVDAHRSLLMLVSPYARKGHVSHVHYSFGSIFKTFWNVLGIPYLNQYDAAANDMADMFSDESDLTPYDALPVDERIFQPQKALDPLDEKFDWKAVGASPVIDNPADMLRESKERDEFRLQDRERKRR